MCSVSFLLSSKMAPHWLHLYSTGLWSESGQILYKFYRIWPLSYWGCDQILYWFYKIWSLSTYRVAPSELWAVASSRRSWCIEYTRAASGFDETFRGSSKEGDQIYSKSEQFWSLSDLERQSDQIYFPWEQPLNLVTLWPWDRRWRGTSWSRWYKRRIFRPCAIPWKRHGTLLLRISDLSRHETISLTYVWSVRFSWQSSPRKIHRRILSACGRWLRGRSDAPKMKKEKPRVIN